MAEDKDDEPRIRISQSATNSKNVTQIGYSSGDITISYPSSDARIEDEARAQLEKLIADLQQTLNQVPEENRKDAEAVAALTTDLVQTSEQEEPNRTVLEIKGEGLKKAAENLAAIAPTVLSIATQIVTHILTMGG